MKREYDTPEFELLSFKFNDVMTASQYVPVPEDPTRAGDEGEDGEFG